MAKPRRGIHTSRCTQGSTPTQTGAQSSSSQRRARPSRHLGLCLFSYSSSGSPRTQLLLAVLALLVLQAVVAVNVVYDETGWTKRDWHKYKIDFDLNNAVDPLDEVIKSAAIKKFLSEARLTSVQGPSKRKTVSKFAGMWARDDGSLVASPSEDAVDQAAEAVMCTTCHSLVSHVWEQLVWAVNHADPLSESSVKDFLEEACEAQVPQKVLTKYRIVQVEAPELDSISLFVVRDRKPTASSSGSSTGAQQQQLTGDSSSGGGSTDNKGAAGSSDGKAAAGSIKDSSGTDGSSKDGSSGSNADGSSGSNADGSAKGPLGSLPSDVTATEVEAVQKACSDLANHHAAAVQKAVWPKAKEYFAQHMTLAQKILTKAQWYNDEAFWEPDVYEDPDGDTTNSPDSSTSLDTIDFPPARKLTPADQLCLDMDIMCPYWALQGQCTANPNYMVGDRKHIGHCKASCKVCTTKPLWKKHPLVKQELRKAATAAGQLLRTSACSASRACMAGGSTISGAVALKEGGSLLPGAVLAKTPGFVLGKPFWDIPKVTTDPRGGLSVRERNTDGSAADPSDEVLLSEGLGSKLVSIPGMDNYFVYQLEYKRRVYQFHSDKDGKLKEEHVLGRYSPTATATAAKRDQLSAHINLEATKAWREQWQLRRAASKHSAGAGGSGGVKPGGEGDVNPPPAPPMLELLDYLPDTESMIAAHWPYMRQMYTEGEACVVEGKTVPRQVELRAACSPDSSLHMLVREPNFCRYIMVLYHPQLCEVDRLKPVPVLVGSSSSSSSSSKKKDAQASSHAEKADGTKGSSPGGTVVSKTKSATEAAAAKEGLKQPSTATKEAEGTASEPDVAAAATGGEASPVKEPAAGSSEGAAHEDSTKQKEATAGEPDATAAASSSDATAAASSSDKVVSARTSNGVRGGVQKGSGTKHSGGSAAGNNLLHNLAGSDSSTKQARFMPSGSAPGVRRAVPTSKAADGIISKAAEGSEQGSEEGGSSKAEKLSTS